MSYKKLTKYIKKTQKMGFSVKEITDILLKSGWKQEDIQKGFEYATQKPILGFLSFFPRLVFNILRETIGILKDNIIFFKNLGTSVFKLSKRVTEVAPQESKFIFGRFHLLWHYFISFIEKTIDIAEKITLPVWTLIALPLALLKTILKFRPKREITAVFKEGAKEPSQVRAMVFHEKISYFDIFRLSKRMFETRRLRTFLTILGVSVGTGTILFLVSLGYGLQNVLFERITTQEALLTLDAFAPVDTVQINLNNQMIDEILKYEGVELIGKMVVIEGGMLVGDDSIVSSIKIANGDFMRMLGERYLGGAFKEDGVVISAASARLLDFDDPKDAVGKNVSFFLLLPESEGSDVIKTHEIEEKLLITGVVDDTVNSFAYFPLEKASQFVLPDYSSIKIKTTGLDFIDPVREKVVALGLQVTALSETVEQAKRIFNIARVILGLFGIITLIVSAIGMLNTMTIALLERTQEVGIMKSVGASNFDIWKLFLAESVIMGFSGGLGGIFIGYAASEIFNYGINFLAKAFGGQSLDLFQQPLWFVLTIVSFASVIGFITGLWPARRAAKLDPLIALKYK